MSRRLFVFVDAVVPTVSGHPADGIAAPRKKIETNTVFPGSFSDIASGGWIGC